MSSIAAVDGRSATLLKLAPVLVLAVAAVMVMAIALGAGCRPVDEIAAPLVRFEDAEVRAYSGGVADLTLEFEIENVNGFDLTLTEMKGNLLVDGVEIGRLNWSGESFCPKREATRVRLPQHLTVRSGHGRIFSDLIDRKPMDRVFRGQATFARGVVLSIFRVATDGELGDHEGASRTPEGG
jgi:hypothetical protein